MTPQTVSPQVSQVPTPRALSSTQGQPPTIDPITERIVTAALKMVYSSTQVAQGLVRMVAATHDRAAGLAHATMTVIGQLMRQVKGIDPKTVYRAVPYVCDAIAEMAVHAKAMPQDPKVYEKALQSMLAQINGKPIPAPERPGRTARDATPQIAFGRTSRPTQRFRSPGEVREAYRNDEIDRLTAARELRRFGFE